LSGRVLHGSLLYLVLEHGNFLNVDILEGSVATCLGCGGIFNKLLYCKFTTECQWKNFESRPAVDEVYHKNVMVPFWLTVYMCINLINLTQLIVLCHEIMGEIPSL